MLWILSRNHALSQEILGSQVCAPRKFELFRSPALGHPPLPAQHDLHRHHRPLGLLATLGSLHNRVRCPSLENPWQGLPSKPRPISHRPWLCYHERSNQTMLPRCHTIYSAIIQYIKPSVGLGLSPTTTKGLVADRHTAAWDYGWPRVLSSEL